MKIPKVSGIGVDIESIQRFRDKEFEKNNKFYRRLFTDTEIDYCLSRRDPFPHFTVRFCAKEALKKALPQNLTLSWKDISIKNDDNGKPIIEFSQAFQGKSDIAGKISAHISLSHDSTKAIAFVVLEID